MPEQIRIDLAGQHAYSVKVLAGASTTTHQVTVPSSLLAEVGLRSEDEEPLVRSSFEFLLEREAPTSILAQFDLDVIGRYFPEYVATMRARFSQSAD